MGSSYDVVRYFPEKIHVSNRIQSMWRSNAHFDIHASANRVLLYSHPFSLNSHPFSTPTLLIIVMLKIYTSCLKIYQCISDNSQVRLLCPTWPQHPYFRFFRDSTCSICSSLDNSRFVLLLGRLQEQGGRPRVSVCISGALISTTVLWPSTSWVIWAKRTFCWSPGNSFNFFSSTVRFTLTAPVSSFESYNTTRSQQLTWSNTQFTR